MAGSVDKALGKLIRCRVAIADRNAFASAQQAWAQLAAVNGFIGQVGGWCQIDPGIAVVVALWRNSDVYGDFMAEAHDRITTASGQGELYVASSVTVGTARAKPGWAWPAQPPVWFAFGSGANPARGGLVIGDRPGSWLVEFGGDPGPETEMTVVSPVPNWHVTGRAPGRYTLSSDVHPPG